MRNKTYLLPDSMILIQTVIHQISQDLPQHKLGLGHFSENHYRCLYHQGRITSADLQSALTGILEYNNITAIFTAGKPPVMRSAVYHCALLYDFFPLPMTSVHWQIQENQALLKLQNDVPTDVRERWLVNGADEALEVTALWQVIENTLGLASQGLHCEVLFDLSPEQTEVWLEESGLSKTTHEQTQAQARLRLQALIGQVGTVITLGDCISVLSGINSSELVTPQFMRIFVSYLNERKVDWHVPSAEIPSFYAAWRSTIKYDANTFLLESTDWQNILATLPDNPLQAIAYQLTSLGIGQQYWASYLQCLTLQMMNSSEPLASYFVNLQPTALADYLAIRLTLERGVLNQICRELWKLEANLDALKGYFNKNLSEFFVRQYLYQGSLPEYLTRKAEALIIRSGSERSNREDWQALADLIQTWQISPSGQCQTGLSQGNSMWRLFRLCQHLALTPKAVAQLEYTDLIYLLKLLDDFDDQKRQRVWLTAFDNHYRDDLFHALRANYTRRLALKSTPAKEAQLIFCMDEREESLRRTIESLSPALATYSAPGYFGLVMNFTSLKATDALPYFPKTLQPAFSVKEVIRVGEEKKWAHYQKGLRAEQNWIGRYQPSLSGNPLLAQILVNVFAPVAGLNLMGQTFYPKMHHQFLSKWWNKIFTPPHTELQFFPLNQDTKTNCQSITIELADLVANFLKAIGLTQGFAPLVVVIGHTAENHNGNSDLKNNCEFCRGYSGGVNARVFAVLANQPEIRNVLKGKGIDIPAETWFIGAEHNTLSEAVVGFDLQDIPANKQQNWQYLSQIFIKTAQLSAHERCRPATRITKKITLKNALSQVQRDILDFSLPPKKHQRLPAFAVVIGRRLCSQGIFLDRQVALLSYDACADKSGSWLEKQLQSFLPVFANDNLQYYFHEIKKTAGDKFNQSAHPPNFWHVINKPVGGNGLRLTKQITEFHTHARLQLIIEASPVLIEQIIARNTDLQSLISGEWLHLSALDPHTGDLFSYEPGLFFKLWQAGNKETAIIDEAIEGYGEYNPILAPFLIKQPVTENY